MSPLSFLGGFAEPEMDNRPATKDDDSTMIDREMNAWRQPMNGDDNDDESNSETPPQTAKSEGPPPTKRPTTNSQTDPPPPTKISSSPSQTTSSLPEEPHEFPSRDGPSSISSLSPEEFRAKYSFQPEELNHVAASLEESPPPVLEASKRQDYIYQLERDLQRLQDEIVVANNGKAINLKSYPQISQALFGVPDQSVAKDVLESMAMSSVLAKLILEHRQTQQKYNKALKQEENAKKKKEKQQKETSGSFSASSSSPSTSSRSTASRQAAPQEEPLILVDTSSFIFRAYYSMPPMHRSDGLPTSAVLGFCNMLNRMIMPQLLKGKQPRVVLCCDAPSPGDGPKTIRHQLYDQYKAHRAEAPMDLIPQFPWIRQAAQAYGMLWVEAPQYEADDVIASLSQMALKEGLTVHIYSGDKDLMQLITDTTDQEQDAGKVEMIDPMTMTHWDHESVVDKWGVPSHQLGDVLALAGDTADNIPGVPGIGPKIAAQLISQFGSLEELLQNLDQVKQVKRREKLENFRDQAILSQQLVRLERGLDWGQMFIDALSEEDEYYPPPEKVADLRVESMNPDRILQFYESMGFVTIRERLLEKLQRQSTISYSYQPKDTFPRKSKTSSPRGNKTSVPNPDDFGDVPF